MIEVFHTGRMLVCIGVHYLMYACQIMSYMTCTTCCYWMTCCKRVYSWVLYAAGMSLENDTHSPLAQVPGLYESLCSSSDITGFVDKTQGTSVTWQPITVRSLYLCSAWKWIWSNSAYCGKHAYIHTLLLMSRCTVALCNYFICVSLGSSCSICS